MIQALFKGIAISLLLVFSVGPVIFTIIKQSINNGRAGGFSFVGGVWLSDFLWAILSNAFSSVVSELLHFEKAIGIFGSIFLISMGVYYLFFKKIIMNEEGITVNAATHAKLFTSGFFLNTLNPGVIAFWLSWATAFSTHTHLQRIIIFSTCLVVNMGSDVLKVILADKVSDKLTLKNISLINKVSGLLLLVFGIGILVGVFYTTGKH
jgi:threonine/homoserine/homoserine lactone efflux protein